MMSYYYEIGVALCLPTDFAHLSHLEWKYQSIILKVKLFL